MTQNNDRNQTTGETTLPAERSTIDRETATKAFLAAVNVCEPDHPRYGTDCYPLTIDEIEQGWCTRTGQYYAKCGHRRGSKKKAYIAFDIDYFASISNPRRAALIVHELTHITEGRHTPGSGHNYAFWHEMVFNAQLLRENIEPVERVLGPIPIDEFEREVIDDATEFVVDNRSETATERRIENAELLGRHDVAAEYRALRDEECGDR